MKYLVRLLVTAVLGVALLGVVSSVQPLAEPAAAQIGTAQAKATATTKTTYVSTKYTAPKRGQTNAGVKALQLRLLKAKMLTTGRATSYFGSLTEAAVKKFQKKYNLKATGKVDRLTWDTLVAKTGKIKITTTTTTTKLDSRCKFGGRALCVDKTKRKLYFVQNSKIIKTMDARFGCTWSTPTREGRFSVLWKSRNHVSSIYHTPMPYAMFFSGGQAVHYSSDFAARGYSGCSHGCVNIRNRAGIAWLFDKIHVGDRVIVYWSH